MTATRIANDLAIGRYARCLLQAGATCIALLWIGTAAAQEAPEFDRPGIGFATSTLPAGAFAWEQGLPDGSTDHSDGVRTTTLTAATLLRLGVTDALEVQLGVDSWGEVRVRGGSLRERDSGGGDGSIAMKWAPATGDGRFSWALLATASLPVGRAPIGGDGHDYDVGVTGAWALTDDDSLSLYVDRSWGDGGSGWLLSPSYGFGITDVLSAYVEAGFGTAAQHMRAAGAGVTWMATARMQLDASFLRGLDSATDDWQGGVGLSIYFD